MRPAPLPTSLGALALLASCGGGEPVVEPADDGPAVWFEDCAEELGVSFVHDFGPVRFYMPEITSSGLGLIDYDGDGDQDLFLAQGGDLEDPRGANLLDRFYRNDDGTFVDVTEEVGIGDPYFSFGPAVGDYDGDGDLDLFVGNVGPNSLYRNDGGTFTNVAAEVGLDHGGWSTSSTWVDFDRDGDLDLFTATYLRWSPAIEHECPSAEGERGYCGPTRYKAAASDRLFENRDGTFVDVTDEIGIQGTVGTSLGVVWGNLDDDPDVEIFVSIDGMENHLWDRQPGGGLKNVAIERQVALNSRGTAEAGMGVLLADLNDDLRFDLYLAHLRNESNTLYTSRGNGFRDNTMRAGLQNPSMQFTGFGVGAVDFDHDGYLDLYLANGRVTIARPFPREDNPYAEADQVYRGLGEGRFEEVLLPPVAGSDEERHGGTAIEVYEAGRGATFTDIDGDLDIDVIVNNYRGPARVLRNVAPKRGEALILDVRERDGLPAVGAEVRITVGERRRLFQVQSTSSYATAADPSIHVGLGDATEVTSAEVTWFDGTVETFGPFAAGKVHRVQRAE